ncbi:16S rRNA pseudouridine(516) synthase [Enterococcus ureilyticus]|uniref:Pseudouridine synthase n=1 Tax=Enterococcus ureilyticus TaxID=1131292 RepID=A0A1E5HB57_9ENTE|nr:pseudouridine synthase [Enterococcus ureilyticus]MBM7690119.1 16S rRNA pseudouridine516 synthase [Enterococcus ureilyticus]MBO0447189.1 rRNA pseudouridine synthase [Enterococcus ureilyticus]OEG22189.1 16S rRNA pseudouridine(516) synthase [Enterococcus ureilyticus]
MRLDKFLAETGVGSRKEAKQLLKKSMVTVNDQVIKEGKTQIDEKQDVVKFAGEKLTYQKYYYYMLHKPQEVISATEDKWDQTVIDLLHDEDFREDLFPVGRLDKDTEGLLLLTNDGQLAHQLLSPKKHVDKEYFAEVAGIVTEEDIDLFAAGFALTNKELVKPSHLTIEAVDEQNQLSKIRLIIQEGKFHQVKRMFEAVDKKVVYLKRLRMGSLWLDENLALGEYRELTAAELEGLKGKV